MNENDKINWKLTKGNAELDVIKQVQDRTAHVLPADYLELIKGNNRGYPEKDAFAFIDPETGREVEHGFGAFISFDKNDQHNILKFLTSPPEGFPEDLVPFASPGNGDYICFDYRQADNQIEPAIAIWLHENRSGEDIAVLANSFRHFIASLRTADDV
jgi:hypothetical protein